MANILVGEDRRDAVKQLHYMDVDDRGRAQVMAFSPYGQIGTDAGGRQRVSQITTLFDGKVVNGHTPLLLQETGSGTFTGGDSKVLMEVTAGQYGILQTRRFYPYFSGKSQLVECTFDHFAPEDGVSKRFGYFESAATAPYTTAIDGIYVLSEDGGISFNIFNSAGGKNTIPMEQWSGYGDLAEYQDPATWDNFTVCLIDFLWLGGAVARLWVRTSRGFTLAHQFDYPGTTQDTFIKCPCKPLRYEIRSTTGAGSFRYICSQIATEGSINEAGIVRSVNTGAAPIVLATAGVTYPVLALSKQAVYRGVASRIADFNLFVTTNNDQVRWTIQVNPSLSAPLSYTPVTLSSVEAAVGNGTITVTGDGAIMASGYITQNSIMPVGLLEDNFLAYMGGDIDNNMDEYVLCATPLSGASNVNIYGSMAYKEF